MKNNEDKIRESLIEFLDSVWHLGDTMLISTNGAKLIVANGFPTSKSICSEYCVRSHCIGCPIYEQKYYWNPTEEDVALFNKAITTNNSLTPKDLAKLDIIRMKFKHHPCIEQKPEEWSEEELTEFEIAMLHIGESFFGKRAGLDPNDKNVVKEQAKLLLELAPMQS